MSYSLPPLLLFIGPGTDARTPHTPPGWLKDPIREHHVEADGERRKSRVGRSMGSADLGPPRPALCFLWVTGMWALMTVPGVWVVWRRFARVVGPWILVLDTWRCLICREVLLLD